MQISALKDPAVFIRCAVIVLFALLPIFFIPVPWIAVLQSKILLMGIVVAAIAVAHAIVQYREGVIHVPRGWLALAAASLPVAYVLSALFSGANASSFVSGIAEQDTVVTAVLFFALFSIGSLSFRSAPHMGDVLVRAFIVGAFGLMLIQIFHVLVPSMTFGVLGAAASSVFGSWHEVAIVAGLAIFLTVSLWGTSTLSRAWKWIALALSIMSAFMFAIVNMIDVWFVFAGLMLASAAHVWWSHRNNSVPLRKVLCFALIGAASLLGGIFGTELYNALPTKLQVLQVEVRPSWQGTFAIGLEAMDGVRSALFGSGPNTFSEQWSLYKPAGVNATEFWNVDFNTGVGFIPTTFVTVGIVGILAWAFLLFTLLFAFVKFMRCANAGERTTSGALFGASLYLAAFHIVYVPTVALSALAFLLLGAVASRSGERTWKFSLKDGDWKDRVCAVAFGFVVLVVLAASFYALRATLSDILVTRSAVVYVRDQDAQKALALVQRALVVYPGNDRAHRAAVELGLIRLGQLASAGGTTDQAVATLQVSLETTIQHGLAAVSINSGDYQNWLALASLYGELAGAGVQGAYDNAKAAYERAYNDNPTNPVPVVQLAQLEISQNKLDEAKRLLDYALGLKPDFAAALLLRSQVFGAQKQYKEAIADAQKVTEIAPEEPLSWYGLGTIQFDSGDYQKAAGSLEKAVALNSNYANALYALGLAYEKLGRTDDALRVLEQVAEANPGNDDVSQHLEHLRSGGATSTSAQ